MTLPHTAHGHQRGPSQTGPQSGRGGMQDLGWLLAGFADRVPGVAHAVAVSADGLLLASSRDLPRD
ncbi:MAG TPA: roadblock/LC7 domain-containing protein, partial [Phytomonospora sp.]